MGVVADAFSAPSALQFEGGGVHVADVEPLLLHLLVRQQAVPRQREPVPALAAARHPPEARPFEQKDGAVGVGEVGGVDVAIRMVSALNGGENLSDALGEASRQDVRSHVEGVHLLDQTQVDRIGLMWKVTLTPLNLPQITLLFWQNIGVLVE